jgi:hypothetical protein
MMERKEGSMKGGDDDDDDNNDGGDATRWKRRYREQQRRIREETHRSTFAISGCSPVSADI